MKALQLTTHKKDEVIDLTERLTRELPESGSGLCVITARHTTCALTFADLDPGTDLDLLEALRAMTPKLAYRHPHNPVHAPDHILSSIISGSLTIPYTNGAFVLGKWQSIVLIEFNGPQERNLTLMLIEEQ